MVAMVSERIKETKRSVPVTPITLENATESLGAKLWQVPSICSPKFPSLSTIKQCGVM